MIFRENCLSGIEGTMSDALISLCRNMPQSDSPLGFMRPFWMWLEPKFGPRKTEQMLLDLVVVLNVVTSMACKCREFHNISDAQLADLIMYIATRWKYTKAAVSDA